MIEQIAISCKNPKKLKMALECILGLGDWSNDHVKATGSVNGIACENKAELNFNYDLGPFEFELIKYEEGKNWLENKSKEENFLSHLGFHIEDPEEFERKYDSLKTAFPIAQEVVTDSHTNEFIKDERRYRYVIFDSRDTIGFDLKIIQRLNLDYKPFVFTPEQKLIKVQDELAELEKKMIDLEAEQDHLEKIVHKEEICERKELDFNDE